MGNTSRRIRATDSKGNPIPSIYRRTGADGAEQYEITYRDTSGKQHWQRVGGGITAARKALAIRQAQRAEGRQMSTDPRLTFNAAADAWWDVRAVRLRNTTQATYQSCLKELRPYFGQRRLAQITADDVARFVTKCQDDGKKGWTIKGYLTVLRSVFKYAQRHMGFAGVNPVTLLDRMERPSIEDERPKRILDADELARLIGAVDDYYRLIFELAAGTGARLGEALGLVWAEIDLDAQTVHFTSQLGFQPIPNAKPDQPQRKPVRLPLKTKRSNRFVEITPALTTRLRAAKVAAPRCGDHYYVFVNREGNPHDHRNIGGRVLERAVKAAKLEDVEQEGETVQHAPTFHSLRHSHASTLIASGWDLQEVADRLGHSDVSVTARAYIHAYESARRSDDRRQRLAALYG